MNLCTSDELPKPPDVSDTELALILESDDPSTFRIPMCLGEPRTDTDKGQFIQNEMMIYVIYYMVYYCIAGEACKVFDVAINPEALKRVHSSELFRQFIMTAALEGLQTKYKVELNIGGEIACF